MKFMQECYIYWIMLAYSDKRKQLTNHPNLRKWSYFRLDLAYSTSVPSLEQKHSSAWKIFKLRYNDIALMSMYITDTFCSFTRNVIFKSCFLLSLYSCSMVYYCKEHASVWKQRLDDGEWIKILGAINCCCPSSLLQVGMRRASLHLGCLWEGICQVPLNCESSKGVHLREKDVHSHFGIQLQFSCDSYVSQNEDEYYFNWFELNSFELQ